MKIKIEHLILIGLGLMALRGLRPRPVEKEVIAERLKRAIEKYPWVAKERAEEYVKLVSKPPQTLTWSEISKLQGAVVRAEARPLPLPIFVGLEALPREAREILPKYFYLQAMLGRG